METSQPDELIDIGENNSREADSNKAAGSSSTTDSKTALLLERTTAGGTKRTAEGEIIHIVSAEDSNEIVDIGDSAGGTTGGVEGEENKKLATHSTDVKQELENADMRLFISNLPKSWNEKRFLKMLRDLNVTFQRARKIHGNNFGHIFFADSAHKAVAFETLARVQSQHEWNVSEAKAHVPPMKRGDQVAAEFKPLLRPTSTGGTSIENSGSADSTGSTICADTAGARKAKEQKKRRLLVVPGEENDPEVYAPDPNRSARDVVSPWWNVPYDEQLQRKLKHVREVLVNITRQCIRDTGAAPQPKWLAELRAHQPCCPLENESVIASPVTQGYRNKVQFTIGHDVQLKPCVGHLLGAVKEGFSAVGDAHDVPTTPPEAEALRKLIQKYVTERSKLQPYQKLKHMGFWRMVTIRTTQTKEILVLVQTNGAAGTTGEVEAERSCLTEFLRTECEAAKLNLASLWWQDWQGVSNSPPPDHPCTRVFGADAVHENLLGIKYRISPTAFFQVNTLATAELYSLVRRWCSGNEKTTLMDIYCGSGTIGLTMASVVREVVGIEIVEEAVKDARLNAQANNITNAAFFAGKAEDLLRDKLRDWSGRSPNFVGIVDPPRNGLHMEAIRSIRACARLRKLIYVSCNQQSLISNAGQLCRPVTNTMKGNPFRPVLAAAVDLFPHTEHTEVVMLFERE